MVNKVASPSVALALGKPSAAAAEPKQGFHITTNELYFGGFAVAGAGIAGGLTAHHASSMIGKIAGGVGMGAVGAAIGVAVGWTVALGLWMNKQQHS
jgi:hypothetical protein